MDHNFHEVENYQFTKEYNHNFYHCKKENIKNKGNINDKYFIFINDNNNNNIFWSKEENNDNIKK